LSYFIKLNDKTGTTKFRWLNLKEKDFLGRPKSRWKDNIKMNFKEIGMDSAEWTNLSQGRENWHYKV
jgi:hypothetical protein